MGISLMRERIADMARRCGDLKPLAPVVSKILYEGNKINKSKGLSPSGTKYSKLSYRTLEDKPRPGGIPFMTHPPTSDIVMFYHVDVHAGVGKLTFIAGWPNLAWPEWHVHATRNRPARDPYGFRRIDLEDIRELMRGYVLKKPLASKFSKWQFWRS